MTEYNFTTTLHPWGPEHGAIGIDSTACYGYFERKDGSEGGGLWFDRHWRTGELNLVDFDGSATLPKAIIEALRAHGVIVDADFE
jgi:hypothetical protein